MLRYETSTDSGPDVAVTGRERSDPKRPGRFSVLGPVRAWSGEQEIDLGAPQQRAVLAILLLRSGVVVSMDQLIERLWDGDPPRTARQTLRTYIWRLRQLLSHPDGSTMIDTVAEGYVFRLEPAGLDLTDFRTHRKQAQRAKEARELHRARDLLRAATALWDEEALSGLPGQYLQGQRARLERMRLDTLEQVLSLELELGADASLIDELSSLVQENPLDERFRGLLMSVLYRTGQQAQALAVYQDAQFVLSEELGVDPGRTLQELHLRILRAEPAMTESASFHLKTLPDAAVGQSEPSVGSLTDDHPQRGWERQMPQDIAGFTGRGIELTRLDTLLDQLGPASGGVICIHGMPGVGKTALAVHWAHRVADQFPDGLVYLNLRGFDPSPTAMGVGEALPALLEMLGQQEVPPGDVARGRSYRDIVTDRRMLILLDNARAAEQVQALLPRVPGVLVVVTSRVQLTGLVVRDQAKTLRLDVLKEDQAQQMFLARMGLPGADVDSAALASIVALCSGLPLALTLVAARGVLGSPVPPVDAGPDGGGNALDVLSDPDPTIDLRAVFSWSYLRLSPEAARLFRLMSVHPGPVLGVTPAMTLAGRPLRVVRAALGELVVANLVEQVEPGWFALHNLLRTYACELYAAEDGPSTRDDAWSRTIQADEHSVQTEACLGNGFPAPRAVGLAAVSYPNDTQVAAPARGRLNGRRVQTNVRMNAGGGPARLLKHHGRE